MYEYTVAVGRGGISYQAIRDLENEVNKKIERGYTPIGGVSFAEIEGGTIYAAQAMVKMRE